MKFGLAQINPTVGDIEGNSAQIIGTIERCIGEGVEVVVFPELCIVGYPPKDLVFRDEFVRANVDAAERIARQCRNITAIVGYVSPNRSGSGKGLLNSAAVCFEGAIRHTYSKLLLPTYDVFDEDRYFSCGTSPQVFSLGKGSNAVQAGVTICEDLWNNRQFEGRRVYGVDPIALTAKAGSKLLINLSASPYRSGVEAEREALFAAQAREQGAALIYVNQVAGNDDLIFDGASLVLDAKGDVVARAAAFEEDFLIVELPAAIGQRIEERPTPIEAIRRALVLGIRDYVQKCGFKDVLLGLSGGVDSAVTAALAVDALGSDRVHGVALPSRYSSEHSIADARTLAESLGVKLMTLPIERIHGAFEETLSGPFAGARKDATEENIQSRIRGSILMALSNKFGWLLLTTGNKSEFAVGYCTLYGDMCGALAVLMDVYKTRVYELAKWINERAGRALIPPRSIEKPPSAELRIGQTDQDTLPPYDVLDAILGQYIELDRSVEKIVEAGFERRTVEWVAKKVDANEYKRKQAPVGLKVTRRAFGTGRRMPIAARYRPA